MGSEVVVLTNLKPDQDARRAIRSACCLRRDPGREPERAVAAPGADGAGHPDRLESGLNAGAAGCAVHYNRVRPRPSDHNKRERAANWPAPNTFRVIAPRPKGASPPERHASGISTRHHRQFALLSMTLPPRSTRNTSTTTSSWGSAQPHFPAGDLVYFIPYLSSIIAEFVSANKIPSRDDRLKSRSAPGWPSSGPFLYRFGPVWSVSPAQRHRLRLLARRWAMSTASPMVTDHLHRAVRGGDPHSTKVSWLARLLIRGLRCICPVRHHVLGGPMAWVGDPGRSGPTHHAGGR